MFKNMITSFIFGVVLFGLAVYLAATFRDNTPVQIVAGVSLVVSVISFFGSWWAAHKRKRKREKEEARQVKKEAKNKTQAE